MNEELLLAIEELRQRPIDRSWFIPVILAGGEIPCLPIGPGETLKDIQGVDFQGDWDRAIAQLLRVIASPMTDGSGKASERELHPGFGYEFFPGPSSIREDCAQFIPLRIDW
jgi:hypothetical protein